MRYDEYITELANQQAVSIKGRHWVGNSTRRERELIGLGRQDRGLMAKLAMGNKEEFIID